MKNSLLLISIICLFAISCKNDDQVEGKGAIPVPASLTEISKDSTMKMIKHYFSPLVDRSVDAIIQQVFLDSSLLRFFSRGNKHTVQLKILTAAIMEHPKLDPKLWNQPTVIFQLKKVNSPASYTYYSFSSGFLFTEPGSSLCPPPRGGCELEESL